MKQKNKILPIILSGGSGDRLWPLSRKGYPKQFVKLYSKLTLMQETALRCEALGFLPPVILSGIKHNFLIQKQLEEVKASPQSIILEPVGRDTAPAITLASLFAKENIDEDTLLLILPSDQYIDDCNHFGTVVEKATEAALQGQLITFGIKPDSPNTNFGYIEADRSREENGVCPVQRFIEKPALNKAQAYCEDPNYFWNGGIFLFKPNVYLEELNKYQPELFQAAEAAWNASDRSNITNISIDHESFEKCEKISVDYAVMEESDKVSCALMNSDWNDVGTWAALADLSPKDEYQNVIQGNVYCENAKNNYLRADSRLLAAVDVEDLVVIETKDAVLVSKKCPNTSIKKTVQRLRADGQVESEIHLKEYRPWGSYEILEEGENFKVKRIIVNPGGILSLQMHHHRAEHWVIVQGTAEVTRDDEVFTLSENQSTFIPLGAKHRIANPGTVPMHFIEVQSGSYLGEDDIVRFEDVYGRSK